jgi:hypothetical protein
MANVAAQVNRVVAADTAGLGGQRLRLTEHLAALLDNVLALQVKYGQTK